MTDEQYHELQRQGRAAKALLDSDAWIEAVAEVTAAVQGEWASAAWSAPSLREQKFAEIKGLALVHDRLSKWISDAKYEADRREKQVARLRIA